MQTKQICGVVDFFNMVRSVNVTECSGKYIRKIDIVLRDIHNQEAVGNLMKYYGITATQNNRGFTVDMLPGMSTPAKKMMDNLYRMRCADARMEPLPDTTEHRISLFTAYAAERHMVNAACVDNALVR